MANAKFKPLSFSTTMRNPNRISGFMSCILPFEGEVLTNDVIAKIIKNIIRKKLYKPNIIKSNKCLHEIYKENEETFTDEQLDLYICKQYARS